MATFVYDGIDENLKAIRGQIDAPTAEIAREALEKQHLEIVNLREASRVIKPVSPASTSSLPSFGFEGTDASGVVRRGTIQAADKRAAFDMLTKERSLNVTILSPAGMTASYMDSDLKEWKAATPPASNAAVPMPIRHAPPKPPEPIKIPTVVKQLVESPTAQVISATQRSYHPLSSTLRLYSAWLLAWYGLFVALGFYSYTRVLPWDIPFVGGFFASPLIFTFTVAIFLFLLLGSIHRQIRGGAIIGSVLMLIGVSAVVGVRFAL
jgi:hypothetical protein